MYEYKECKYILGEIFDNLHVHAAHFSSLDFTISKNSNKELSFIKSMILDLSIKSTKVLKKVISI